MDLAMMIYERAKEIEEEEKSKNFIEFKISVHIHGGGDRSCRDEEGSFKIYPIDDDPGGVMVVFGEMSWTYRKKAYELDRMMLVLLRQIMRNIIHALGENGITDEMIYFEVWYRQKRVFFDEYLIMDYISIPDLSNCSLYECNENDELLAIQRIFQSYIEICMGLFPVPIPIPIPISSPV